MTPRSILTPTERMILTTLSLADAHLSIVELAEIVECSPLTVRLALQKLTKSNTINRALQGQKAYYTSKDFTARMLENTRYSEYIDIAPNTRTYEELVQDAVKAFALNGVKHSSATVQQIFPDTHEGMGGIEFFTWDATRNAGRSARRLAYLFREGI